MGRHDTHTHVIPYVMRGPKELREAEVKYGNLCQAKQQEERTEVMRDGQGGPKPFRSERTWAKM